MSDWKTILCAVDLLHDSSALLDAAVSLSKKLGAELTLLYVLPTGGPETIISPPERIEGMLTEASLPLRDMAATAGAALGRTVESRVEHGQPASEILRVAEETACDLLVLATHGRRGLERALFGSVSEKVVRAARCPVLTVHP
ncbi:MAG: universal stress protein [Deltaproteobacteria bacterium]